MARPTKFDKKYIDMLKDYFSDAPYREVMKKVVSKSGDVIEIPENKANNFKTLASFARKIGVHRETLLNWSKENAEFFDAYKEASLYQEEYLTVNGLLGLINPLFGMFVSKNNIGYVDKRELEVTENSTLADKVNKARSKAKK